MSGGTTTVHASVHAATDLTGFGVLGHLQEMADASSCSASIELSALPLFDRVLEWAAAQVVPGRTAEIIAWANGFTRWHSAEDRPRTVSELWAYTGHKPGQRRRKGERANWSDDAKKRTYLIAAGFVKQLDAQCKREGGIAEHQDSCACSPYRKVYDARREHTRENVHATECVRCGPSGKPAAPGSPWSPAHQMADAIRVTGKTFLRDLWCESKRIHEGRNSA